MTGSLRKFAIRGCGAVALAYTLCTAAYAQTRVVDPHSAKHGERTAVSNLGDRDPWGQPARSGCTWSRIQVPTSQGLRWQAIEDCDPDMWH